MTKALKRRETREARLCHNSDKEGINQRMGG